MTRRKAMFNDLHNLAEIDYDSSIIMPMHILFKSAYFLNEIALNREIKQKDVSLEQNEIEKLKEIGCDDGFISLYNKLINRKRSKSEAGFCCLLLGTMFGFLLKDCSPKQRELIKNLDLFKTEKETIRKQNSKNAQCKANKPEKIEARKKIFEMARDICKRSKAKLTINAIATKISEMLLLNGNKKDYGINAENPKNTIYYWLKKYPNEWKQ